MSTAFWKPGTTGPGSTVDRASEIEGGAILSSAPIGIGQLSVQAQRERLPIFKHRTSSTWKNILRRVEFFSASIRRKRLCSDDHSQEMSSCIVLNDLA